MGQFIQGNIIFTVRAWIWKILFNIPWFELPDKKLSQTQTVIEHQVGDEKWLNSNIRCKMVAFRIWVKK